MGVLHPVTVRVTVLVRNKFDLAGFDALKSLCGKVFHLEEPLRRELRLDDRVGPFRISHRRCIFLHLDKVAGLLQHLDNLLSGLETILAHQNLSLLVQAAVVIDDVNNRQIVAKSDLIVMSVVSRGDLQASSSEIHLHITVLDDRDLPVDQRDEHLLAFQPMMSLIGRIDTDGGIGHNRLRTGRGDHEILVRRIAVAIGDIIFKVIEMALGVPVDDLVVTDGGQCHWIPVDHTHTSIYHTFLIEIAECGDHGVGKLRLHREPCAVPVTGSAKLAELLENDSPVLLLPLPGIFHKLLTGKVFLGYSHTLELGHNLAFRCDGCMVRTRYPAGILAVHSGLADQYIVKRVVQHVTHMQDSRHVRRRDYYRIRLFLIRLRVEALVLGPPGVPFVFYFRRIVLCGKFFFLAHITAYNIQSLQI